MVRLSGPFMIFFLNLAVKHVHKTHVWRDFFYTRSQRVLVVRKGEVTSFCRAQMHNTNENYRPIESIEISLAWHVLN